jgi:hypothetical protein
VAEENVGGDLVDPDPPDPFSSFVEFGQLLDFRTVGAHRFMTLHAESNAGQARLILAVYIGVTVSTLHSNFDMLLVVE